MAPSKESGWLLYISLAAKCGCVVTSLLHWASPGGPAWGRYWWTRRGLGIGNAIPGPRGLPVIGSMWLMTGLAHRKLAAEAASSWARRRLMAFSLGETQVVVTADPDVARELLASPAFAGRPVKESAYGLMFHRAIGFAPYGAYWHALRRVASTHLFSPRQVAASAAQRAVIAWHMVEAMKTAAASFPCARPVMSRMLPITGSPRGPGMALPMPKPLLVHQYLPHAGPTGDAQCRSDVTTQATSKTATKPTTR